MSTSVQTTDKICQQLQVLRAEDFVVVNGANLGDPISFANDILLDDTYELREGAALGVLAYHHEDSNKFSICNTSKVGTAGSTVFLDCCMTLMPTSGETVEALLLVETDKDGMVEQVYLNPLTPLLPKTTYSLVKADRDTAGEKLALLAAASFAKGTKITTYTGAQVPIEDLRVGDRILTRDSGSQRIRWIGQSTLRATGDFAPVRIAKGALNNLNDLVVHPDHRLFVYQRNDQIGAGKAELLIKASHLVNGDTVTRLEGGYVDYFQIIFDDHQIVFAEGIGAETTMITAANKLVVPQEINETLKQSQIGMPQSDTLAYEVNEQLLKRPDAAELLRRASSR